MYCKKSPDEAAADDAIPRQFGTYQTEPMLSSEEKAQEMERTSSDTAPAAVDFERICRNAWNDHYHKCAPAISYETYRYIWNDCISRLDLVTRTEMAREVAAVATESQGQAPAITGDLSIEMTRAGKRTLDGIDTIESLHKHSAGIANSVYAAMVAAKSRVEMAQRPRIFVDMDGVIVDFEAYKSERGLTGEEVKKTPNAYLEMPAIPGAISAVRTLIGMGFEVWIATKPPTGVPYAYSDKAAWIMRELPELKRRIIVTHDKGLLGDVGDFLCDDRPHKANCEMFQGTLLRFVDGYHWPQALEFFRSLQSQPQQVSEKGGLS